MTHEIKTHDFCSRFIFIYFVFPWIYVRYSYKCCMGFIFFFLHYRFMLKCRQLFFFHFCLHICLSTQHIHTKWSLLMVFPMSHHNSFKRVKINLPSLNTTTHTPHTITHTDFLSIKGSFSSYYPTTYHKITSWGKMALSIHFCIRTKILLSISLCILTTLLPLVRLSETKMSPFSSSSHLLEFRMSFLLYFLI